MNRGILIKTRNQIQKAKLQPDKLRQQQYVIQMKINLFLMTPRSPSSNSKTNSRTSNNQLSKTTQARCISKSCKQFTRHMKKIKVQGK